LKAPAKKAKAPVKPQKAAAKPAAAKKPAAKPATKAKPVAKSAAKPVPKPKPVSKAAAKPAPAAKKPAAKAKPVTKPVAKPAAKPVAKPAAKKAPVSPKVETKAAKPPVKSPVPASVAAPKPAPAPVVPAPAVVQLAKPPRPSSRLAQITVPSMSQSVASTAAKSSYTQTMASPVLVTPPLPVKKDPKLANNWKAKTAEQLSDAEVLAMPDTEYMNDKQMAFFRLKLSQLKQDILNSAGETTEHLREETVIVPDPADRATIEEEHALELRTRDRERKLLKKIEQSIARIDAGDYGYCDETGEPIGVGRLLARPTATLSLEAQQRRELKQKMFGD